MYYVRYSYLMTDDMCMVYHLVKFSSITSIPNNEVVQNSSDEYNECLEKVGYVVKLKTGGINNIKMN